MVGDNTKLKLKSPLLPIRHERDFFVCDVFDAPVKADRAGMEHPIFSLSKKPDMKIRRYENGELWAEIRPSTKGLATVFDRDILIYCISQLVAAINDGRQVGKHLRLRAHDLLIATNRDSSGRGYIQLKEALDRLQGTQIATNIVTGGKEKYSVFSLVKEASITRSLGRDGRMQDIELELSDWIFDAIYAQEVLTLDRRYFQLAKPLERRLYELARKHVGMQPEFRIGIEKLRLKTGSQSTEKEFRRLLQTIIKDDQQHNHIPGYRFKIDGDMVIMGPKPDALPSPVNASNRPQLKTETYEKAKRAAPGWDVYTLEAEWQEWIAERGIVPQSADAHFLSFCKHRGRHPQQPEGETLPLLL